MVIVNDFQTGCSALVAPLQIHSDCSREASGDFEDTSKRSTCDRLQIGSSGYLAAQMTPPATPNGSQEDLEEHMDVPQPIFHNFLRAFYPFNPSYTISDSTVTLPLNEGDVILVHSIHTNGWADGTLLRSGARGWLPTNYCEPYDPESMRSLLKGLLNFWDLLRSGHTTDSELFGNQEFMRGLIAGVRHLLERSNCLTREAPSVKSSDGIRRSRKALLSDLSSLVKTAKRVQEITTLLPSTSDSEDVNNLIDEMVLKAFKIVTRGVRFLDVLDDDLRNRQAPNMAMPTVMEECSVPPTPPADSISFDHALQASEATSRRTSKCSASNVTSQHASESQTNQNSCKRSSSVYSPLSDTSRPLSVGLNRKSVSHRVSTAGPPHAVQPLNLVSERLSSSHDTLLSYLGSFIGRLHLQSQSSRELRLNIGKSISAGRTLLSIVEIVCSHDSRSQQCLRQTKETMYHCINQLILVARECIKPSSADDYDIMTPEEGVRIIDAATGCVVAAGECVANTRFVIERIGDFELDSKIHGLGIDGSFLEAPSYSGYAKHATLPDTAQEQSEQPLPPPTSISYQEKPLPDVPTQSTEPPTEAPTSEPTIDPLTTGDLTMNARSSAASLLPPLPTFASPIVLQDESNTLEPRPDNDGDLQSSFQSDMTTVSTADTNCTSFSNVRDSEASMMSQTSTRATTPDTVPFIPSHQSSVSDLSMSESQTTSADDEVETRILEKTYAHELLHNKEGQITGGTLRALIERLTPNHSTPDAIFVSAFYLTFRLFVTPIEFAQALVERFEGVAENPHIAGPVRLRVCNIFKGWLESQWRSGLDYEALPVLESFAQGELSRVLPAVGRQLLELVRKVSSADGLLVPRLVSSMGKSSTSVAQYVPPDTPVPAPIVSHRQANALKNWKLGGSSPSILEFDPLELARQFTIKEMNIFCSITPEELLASEWTKKSGSNAINVKAMSTLSTDISNLVTDTVLQYDDAKKRAMVVKHWIKIAQKCLELNNYDSLMAIICSLNSSGIQRLKRTWDIVSQKRKDMLGVLQDIVEPAKNQLVLRQRIQDHVPPCLPFVGTYLTDLYFVDHGNPATRRLPGIGGGCGTAVINFDKHIRTAKIIGELQRFQIPYRLTEVPELQEWIQAQIVRVRSSNDSNNTVQQYYRKSLLLEPRTTSQRPSPVEAQVTFPHTSKEIFDMFSWTHAREKLL
ncbi:MAG: hypothetical protein M1818_008323 [Claussenomyces sp. TS43310]|nr:MAG: hypothetical protein M1818_008323 [Claussenomyces sp. TS43310]